MDRYQLLKEMRNGHKQLIQALEKVEPAKWDQPLLSGGWSVKDSLAHLAFWERRTLSIYRAIKNGREPSPSFKDRNIDEINAEVHAERKNWTVEQALQEEAAAFQDLLDLVDNAPEEDLFGPYQFEWTNSAPFYEWIEGNTFAHFPEHLDMIKQAGLLSAS